MKAMKDLLCPLSHPVQQCCQESLCNRRTQHLRRELTFDRGMGGWESSRPLSEAGAHFSLVLQNFPGIEARGHTGEGPLVKCLVSSISDFSS